VKSSKKEGKIRNNSSNGPDILGHTQLLSLETFSSLPLSVQRHRTSAVSADISTSILSTNKWITKQNAQLLRSNKID